MRFLPVLLLILLSSFQQAPIESLSFRSYNSKPFSGKSLSSSKAVVFVFLMPDCPFCQKYSKTLNELSKQYSSKGVLFEGVITGDLYTDKEVQDFIKDYRICFPLIHDKDKKLLRYFRISVSPSVVVTDAKGKVQYKGLIDNWPIVPGKTRQTISENYLRDVLNQIDNGKPVTVKNTEAVGCIIE